MSTPGEREQPGRYQRSPSGLVGALLILLLLVGGYVVLQSLGHDQHTRTVATVRYRPVVQQARADHRLFVLAPRPMPPGWRATSVGYRPGRSPTWHLGMLTGSGSYVGIEESLDSEQDMVSEFVDKAAERGGTVRLRGHTWRVWTDQGGDYALVLATRKETVLVGGSASASDVRRLLRSASLGSLGSTGPAS